MKRYYVYKIRENKTNNVVYIGETDQPKARWNTHSAPLGKFIKGLYYMDVIDEYVFENRKDAFDYQCALQKEYGLKTDYEKQRNQIKYLLSSKNKRGGKARTQKAFAGQCVELECPHCKSKGIGRIMYRWHFDKCNKLQKLMNSVIK